MLGASTKFFMETTTVVTLVIQGSTFIDVPYYNMPYPQYQSSPTTYSPSFEKKILQTLDIIEINNQILHSFMQSLTELEILIDQPAIAFSREEESELPSRPKMIIKGQYLARSFNILVTFSEQSIMTFENKMVIE